MRALEFCTDTLFFLLLSSFLLLASPVFADNSAILTEERIKDFIHKTSDISNGQASGMSPEEIKTFLLAHLHDQARFKSKMVYNIPGYPPKETSLALNKEDFIKNIESGSQAVGEYSHEIQVKSVKISTDKRKATVLTNGKEEGFIAVNEGPEAQKVPIIGQSTCHQIIMLDTSNVIQMFNANCNTEIRFQD